MIGKIFVILVLAFQLGADAKFPVSAVAKQSKSLYASHKISKNLSYKGLFVVAPKAEYAEQYVDWWTRKNALKFNSTYGMRVELYRKYFTYLEVHQKDKGLRRSYTWFVISEKTGEVVATIGLNDVDATSKTAYVCYAVSDKHEHQGIATKSLYLLLKLAFDVLGLERVSSTVAVGNEISKKIMAKYEFVPEGLLRKHYLVYDEDNGGAQRRDFEIYGMLKPEWEKIKAKMKA